MWSGNNHASPQQSFGRIGEFLELPQVLQQDADARRRAAFAGLSHIEVEA
jgi:hypothetical protein